MLSGSLHLAGGDKDHQRNKAVSKECQTVLIQHGNKEDRKFWGKISVLYKLVKEDLTGK